MPDVPPPETLRDLAEMNPELLDRVPITFELMFWGVLLGFPVLRLRGDYLAIVTLAFGEIIRLVLLNWQSFTGGPNGIPSIPRPSFFGWLPFTDDDDGFAAFFGIEYNAIHRIVFLFYLILALALITNWVTLRMRRLPIGRAWEAMREDEIACRSLGINTTNTKLTAFAMGAMFGGFAGAFFATRQGFISPESFVFGESALILAIVVLGGMGSQIGVVVAAALLVILPEIGRHLGEGPVDAAALSLGCEFLADGSSYSPDFAALARACGADGIRIEHPEQLEPALREACRSGRATVIDLLPQEHRGGVRRHCPEAFCFFSQAWKPLSRYALGGRSSASRALSISSFSLAWL